MEGRRQAIMTQLTLIDERLKEVNRNSGEIESKIYQILREALFQLQQETQKKVFNPPTSLFVQFLLSSTFVIYLFIVNQLAILLGDELELRRQLEQIEWLENFLRFQVQVSSKTSFPPSSPPSLSLSLPPLPLPLPFLLFSDLLISW